MYKPVNTSDLSGTWEEVETRIRPKMPIANQGDLLISQEKDGDTSFQEDAGKRFFKGFLIAIPINIALWCMAIYLAFLISKFLPVSL